MQKTKLRFILVALVAVVAVSLSVQGREKKVQMKDLPPAVQATVKEQSTGAELRGLAKEVEKGKTFYEAELIVNGRHKDVLIGADGKVVEIEEQVALNNLPSAVKAEIEKQAGKGKILMVESVTKDNALAFYEAHVKSGLRTREIKIATDGKLMK